MNFLKSFILLLIVFCALYTSHAQKIGYVASQTIRDKFPEAQQAEQRLQTMVDNWKRELEDQQKVINEIDIEIKKNRLIWTDQEKTEKEKILERKKKEREEYATKKLGPNGEYDAAVALVFRGVEEKIYAAIQDASFDDGYDIVWDKSSQPLAFINPKYDLTLKVLKKLGIDVDDLEKKQKEAIDKDPRNKVVTPPASTSGVKRTRSRTPIVVPDEKPEEKKTSDPNGTNTLPKQPIQQSIIPDLPETEQIKKPV
jgi:outer membrane protein